MEMRKYNAPDGEGIYTIDYDNGKWVAVIYDDRTCTDGYEIVESDYIELCARIANIYM